MYFDTSNWFGNRLTQMCWDIDSTKNFFIYFFFTYLKAEYTGLTRMPAPPLICNYPNIQSCGSSAMFKIIEIKTFTLNNEKMGENVRNDSYHGIPVAGRQAAKCFRNLIWNFFFFQSDNKLVLNMKPKKTKKKNTEWSAGITVVDEGGQESTMDDRKSEVTQITFICFSVHHGCISECTKLQTFR